MALFPVQYLKRAFADQYNTNLLNLVNLLIKQNCDLYKISQ